MKILKVGTQTRSVVTVEWEVGRLKRAEMYYRYEGTGQWTYPTQRGEGRVRGREVLAKLEQAFQDWFRGGH